MSNQHVDAGVEIILKLNNDTNEVMETMVKLEDGTLFTVDSFVEWLKNTGFPSAISYTLEVMNSDFNYSKLSQFITDQPGNAALNENLFELASKNKDYSRWIKNYDTLLKGAKDLVALGNEATKIATAITNLSKIDEDDSNYHSQRAEAIAGISTSLFNMAGTLSNRIPGLLGDLISAELETAVAVLETGSNILINYIQRLENLEAEIDALTGENQDTIEGIKAINEFTEAFAPLIGNTGSIDGLSNINSLLNRFEKACYEYEREFNRDINGDDIFIRLQTVQIIFVSPANG